jgi:uncharacterized protein (UPF0332 family)
MGPKQTAELHLIKAAEFLAAARIDLNAGHVNAATSNAVVSGINSKDAMCLKLTGSTSKSDDHGDAVAELLAAGKRAADLAPVLTRLLKLKTRSQYQTTSVARSDAAKAIAWAERMYEGAYAALRA